MNSRRLLPLLRMLALIPMLLGLALPARAQPAPAAPPNIVFILADDLGYGDISALNPQSKIKTPQIDRIAAQGLVFTEAHSSSAVCTPSRYSILTGRYNWRSRMKTGTLEGFSKPLIEPGRLTAAELLKKQGYRTACIGKWHLGLDWPQLNGNESKPNPSSRQKRQAKNNGQPGAQIDFTKRIGDGPTTLGFDYFFGISASLDMPPYVFIENDRVTAQPTIPDGQLTGADGQKTRVGPQAPGFAAEEVLPTLTGKAIEFIRQNTGRSKQPFFLYLALPTPHTPLSPTRDWLGKSGLNEYADYVMETDDAIGKVFRALQENQATANTLVIITSDNGCAPAAGFAFMQAHGHDPSAGRRGHKADIYDGGHRIPMIAYWPGRMAPGNQCDRFVCLGDFMATCADLLQAKVPADAAEDSISFLPLLLDPKAAPLRRVLVESSINGSFGLREGNWKLALCPDSGGWSFPRPGKDSTAGLPRFQLFDLAADPAEKTNVMNQHPEIVERLGGLMRDYIVNGRSTPGPPQKNTPVNSWPQVEWLNQFKTNAPAPGLADPKI